MKLRNANYQSLNEPRYLAKGTQLTKANRQTPLTVSSFTNCEAVMIMNHQEKKMR